MIFGLIFMADPKEIMEIWKFKKIVYIINLNHIFGKWVAKFVYPDDKDNLEFNFDRGFDDVFLLKKMIHHFLHSCKKGWMYNVNLFFWEQELIHYPDKEPVSWQEAIQESCLIFTPKTRHRSELCR